MNVSAVKDLNPTAPSMNTVFEKDGGREAVKSGCRMGPVDRGHRQLAGQVLKKRKGPLNDCFLRQIRHQCSLSTRQAVATKQEKFQIHLYRSFLNSRHLSMICTH